MHEIKTHVALGDLGDCIGVFNEYESKRSYLKNEQIDKINPFIRYVNSQTLAELMVALDELHDTYGMTGFLPALVTGKRKPSGTGTNLAQKVCRWFVDEPPTRTALEHTREALTAWSIDRARPKKDLGLSDEGYGPLYLFSPLEDIIKAREDLRLASMLMAWLVGKTDFQTAHGLPANDRGAKLRLIDEEEPKYLHDYYQALKKDTGNELLEIQYYISVKQMHLYRPNDIRGSVQSYVSDAFTLLMSDQRKTVSPIDLSVRTIFHTILSAAWSYFANGLAQKDGPGCISVCKHCHRFFVQQRKTRQFCSNSCRVMHSRSDSE